MEVIIQAKKFKEQVSALQGILAKKETIPALSKIKIDARGNGDLVMTATDLDVSLIIEQETDILQPGSICLNGRKLGLIAGNLPNEPIHLKLDKSGEKMEFHAGRFKSKLAGTDSTSFPEITRSGGEWIKIPATVFYEGLKHTIFAVTEASSRLTIGGILIMFDGSSLKMVSTDGHRLCYFRMMIASGSDQSLRCLLPIKAARELKSLIADEIRANPKAEIKFKQGSQLEFEIGNKTMTAREITGNFPDWEMVIPKEFESFAEINAGDFAQALTRVGVMADDTHRRILFTFHQDKVILRSESPETGNSIEEIGCTFQKLKNSENETSEIADGWKIAFNTKYLMEFLAIQPFKQSESRVIWKFGTNSSPSLLTFEGEERLFSYVLVPLK
jgi:DNA polymerase-3 subunit beta